MNKTYNKLVLIGFTALGGVLIRFGLEKVWGLVTGETPPDTKDPDVPAVVAVSWAMASAAALAVVPILVARFTNKRNLTS